MKTGESSFQAVPFCPSFSVFSFLFQNLLGFFLLMDVGEPKIPKNQAKSEKPKERFSYRTAMKTINDAFLEFLNEQKKDLVPGLITTMKT